MKKYLKLLPVCVLALSAFAPRASAVTFITDWTSTTNYDDDFMINGSATGTLQVGVSTINVSFTGDVRALEENHTEVFNNARPSNISNQTIYTPSLSISDAIGIWGTSGVTNTITFSSPVQDPILWINSLGRGGDWDPLTYTQTWTFDTPFVLLSSLYAAGGSAEANFEANPYQMTVSGMDLIGQEGHGSIQFPGLISSISWTSDIPEQSAFFQVGYNTAAIPEPSTYAMLFGALALGGTIYWKRGRRVTA